MKVINTKEQNLTFRQVCPECKKELEYDFGDIEKDESGVYIICPVCGHKIGLSYGKPDNPKAVSAIENNESVENHETVALEPGKWYVFDDEINGRPKRMLFKCKFKNIVENPQTGQITDLTYAPKTVVKFKELKATDLCKGDVVKFLSAGIGSSFVGILDSVCPYGLNMFKVTCECLLSVYNNTETFTVDKETYAVTDVVPADGYEYAHLKSVMFHHGLKWDAETMSVVNVPVNAYGETGHIEDDENADTEQDETPVYGVSESKKPKYSEGDWIVYRHKTMMVESIDDGGMYWLTNKDTSFGVGAEFVDNDSEIWTPEMENDGLYVNVIDGEAYRKPDGGITCGRGIMQSAKDSVARMYLYVSNETDDEVETDDGYVIIRNATIKPMTASEIENFDSYLFTDEKCRWNSEKKRLEFMYEYKFCVGDIIIMTNDRKRFYKIIECVDGEHDCSENHYVVESVFWDKKTNVVNYSERTEISVIQQDDFEAVDFSTVVYSFVKDDIDNMLDFIDKYSSCLEVKESVADFRNRILEIEELRK